MVKQFRYIYSPLLSRSQSLLDLLCSLIREKEGASIIDPPDYEPKSAPDVKDTLINIFPDNPVAAMAEGSMLQTIVFALLGFAISKSGESGKKILGLFESANTVMLELIMFIVSLAPYGVFCLMMKLGLNIGLDEILKLAKYFFTVVVVLIFHGFVVYSLLIFFFTKLNPFIFLRKMREALLVAFSTSSSGATMPITMSIVQNKLGVKSRIASFSVPLGATINHGWNSNQQRHCFHCSVLWDSSHSRSISYGNFNCYIGFNRHCGGPRCWINYVNNGLRPVGLPVEGIGLIIE